jgi:Ca-activated chloride channel family protein
MSAQNDMFFQLWSGGMNPGEASALRAKLEASASLKREYEDACQVFEALKSASQVDAKLDSAFSAQVMSQVYAVGLVKKERLFMKTRKLLVALLLVGLGGGILLASPETMTRLLIVAEGGLGALLMMLLLFAGLFSILRRNLRFASGFCTAALALFVMRSQLGTFYNSQGVASTSPEGRSEAAANPSSEIKYNDTRISSGVNSLLGALDSLSKDKKEDAPAASAPLEEPARKDSSRAKAAPQTEERYSDLLTRFNSAPLAVVKGGQNEPLQPVLNDSGVTDAEVRQQQFEKETAQKFKGVLERMSETEASVIGSTSTAPSKAREGASAAAGLGRGQGFAGAEAPLALQAPAPGLAPYAAVPMPSAQNTERYGSYEENVRVAVQTQSFSTFSADVDTGSYSNLRRFVSGGSLPPADAVRIEEYVNYFPYGYKTPSDAPLGVDYEIAPSPFDKNRHLVRFGVTTKKASSQQSTPWNLVFLVDVSGSMDEPNKLPLVRQSLKVLTENMRPDDQVAIVTYAGTTGVALEPTLGRDKARILDVISRLGAGGSTNGSGGIEAAYALARQSFVKGGVNRVVLATDGDFNVGTTSFSELVNMIEAKRKTGITLTTLGFGTGNINEHMMEQLANKGNGNFFYIDSFQEAEKVLKKDLVANMQVAAKDVKLQVEFNPRQVKEYRLIGFDNRKLNKEDFTNDAKDAGELGLGHQVTAIYEVLLASSPIEPDSLQGSRYQRPEQIKVNEDHAAELGFLRIRYKEPEGEISKELSFPLATPKGTEFSEASQDFRFAASVALFGQVLRESRYATGYSLREVRRIAESARGDDSSGLRSEFLRLMDSVIALKGESAGER